MIAEEEEDEEEEFLESLPVDMMEDEDLEQMKAMAQKASFLTRDLSSRFVSAHACHVFFLCRIRVLFSAVVCVPL